MSEFPQFYDVNFIKKDQDDITVVSSAGTVDNCFDYNRTTEWSSIGSNDSITEYIDVIFQAIDGEKESRIIDRIILTGINIKAFKLYYNVWSGSAWTGWVEINNTINNTNSNLIVSFSSVTAWRIKLDMYTTMVGGQQKVISEFVVTKLLYESTMPMDSFKIKNKQAAIIRRLYSGHGQMIHRYDKWAASMGFQQITILELNSLKEIYDRHSAFIILAEPYDYLGAYDKPEEFYRVLWASSWGQQYFNRIKGAGYNIKMNLEEV